MAKELKSIELGKVVKCTAIIVNSEKSLLPIVEAEDYLNVKVPLSFRKNLKEGQKFYLRVLPDETAKKPRYICTNVFEIHESRN